MDASDAGTFEFFPPFNSHRVFQASRLSGQKARMHSIKSMSASSLDTQRERKAN